jgi:cyclohexanone monooxygenase
MMLDAVVVGAGFSGLYAIHRLREQGLSLRCIEAAPDVGGVWFWNRYPGARCDVESLQYSYSFSREIELEWQWSERFSGQPEILAYLRFVADRMDLRRDIDFGTRVVRAVWDEDARCWDVTTDAGETLRGRHLIMASGGLSVTQIPDFPGVASFRGRTCHTGMWPADLVDFAGKRVGLIGTGSSGIQAAPVLAQSAGDLFVFQRTPNFIIPAVNRKLDDADRAKWNDHSTELRALAKRIGTIYEFSPHGAMEVDAASREAEYRRRWEAGGVAFVHAFNNLYLDQAANDTAADFVRARIREIVSDPVVAEKLCPKDHPLGSKRICVASGYYEAFNRENVHLVDLREEPMLTITPEGIRTSAREIALDVIIFATGYDALTGALSAIDIQGVGGVRLAEKWAQGPVNYLGLMTEKFPNMYIVTGPGSPSVLVNMAIAIEQHVDWIVECIAALRARGAVAIEPEAQAERDWVRHVNDEADKTLFVKAKSWYIGANIPGKPRVFLPFVGGIGRYRIKCDEVAAQGYQGFRLLF